MTSASSMNTLRAKIETLKSSNKCNHLAGDGVLGHDERQQRDGDDLGGVRLGGGDTNLAASVDVDAAVRRRSDGGANCVGHPHAQRALLLRVVQCLRRDSSKCQKTSILKAGLGIFEIRYL